MKQFLLSIFLFSSLIYNAQIVIKPIIIGAGNGCNDTIVVSGLNVPSNTQLVYVDQNLVETVINFNDTIILSECPSTNPFRLNYTGTVDTICFSSAMRLENNFLINAYQAPSSPVTNDGSIDLYFMDGMANLFYEAYDSIGNLLTVNNIGNSTIRVSNFGFTKIMMMDLQDTTYNYIAIRNNYAAPINNLLSVNTTIQNETVGCDGSAIITPTSGSGPYTFQMTGQSAVTSGTFNNLCPGYYEVLITDSGSGNNVLSQFIIVNSSNAIIDSSAINSNAQDTIILNFSSCVYDYTTAVDSINFNYTYLSGPSNAADFAVGLTIYQNMNSIVLQDTLTLDSNAVYMFEFGIYCNFFKASFSGQKFYVANPNPTAGLTDLNIPQVFVYPNPVLDKLQIQGDFNEGEIYTSEGKLIKAFSDKVLDVSVLEAGVYFLKIDGSKKTFRFVKL